MRAGPGPEGGPALHGGGGERGQQRRLLADVGRLRTVVGGERAALAQEAQDAPAQNVGEWEYAVDPEAKQRALAAVAEMCRRRPIRTYPAPV